MIKSICTALVFAISATAAAEAASIRPMAEVSPTGSNTNNPGNWGRGYEFTVTAANVWVTELGHVTPAQGANADYDIVLWDVVTQSQIASVSNLTGTVSATGWEFHAVTPVELIQGRNYAVTLYGSGNNESYYFSTSSAYQPSGVIDYVTMRYCNGCSSTQFGTRLLGGYNYGYADIGYQFGQPSQSPSPSAVPLPAALPMLAAGLGLTGVMGRRRRKA